MENNNIIVYKTETCPKCAVLCKKLDQKGIPYKICTDTALMSEKGIMSVPVLEINGHLYNYMNAIRFVNEV